MKEGEGEADREKEKTGDIQRKKSQLEDRHQWTRRLPSRETATVAIQNKRNPERIKAESKHKQSQTQKQLRTESQNHIPIQYSRYRKLSEDRTRNQRKERHTVASVDERDIGKDVTRIITAGVNNKESRNDVGRGKV